ncbi:hypothetical protein Glove_421g34 [Diversispora epigaea]|uniref:Protein kinase domain-containing protein n=1 Tax=Diversispora epigaea TaxID=1348612 RepID=A0A397H0U9_9GLOM|nr:hypothetical protein Glove_421g34 [Diversispora epigaea]
MSFGECPECNQGRSGYNWCKLCTSKHFQNDFNNWTSGNDKIDKFIQDAQLNANYSSDVIEWIPYDRFKGVKQIGKGGFGTIHYASWIDGYIRKWDIKNQQWKRYDKNREVEVALKKFDNFVNFNDVLNEMKIHLETWTNYNTSIRFYGITQDPETHSYMMVLDYAKDGNLREYLKINFNNINWEQKLENLYRLSARLMSIHELDIVHQDFHPGNILSDDFNYNLKISDFGLSKLIGANPNNPEKKNIFGVLSYIAPEVLSGEKYTKAADVYSYGIIAYEMVTGFPPYPDIPHDLDLAMKICNGLRPKIPFHVPKLITRMIMRCWDARVTYRPTFKELKDELWKYFDDYYKYLKDRKNKDSEIVIQIKKAEEFSANQESTNSTTTTPLNYQTHPQAIYTSRLLNFSKLPKPKNEENFEKKLEELTISDLYPNLAMKICNGLRPKIPFHVPKLITRMIMRCWDARVTYRPTFKELKDELWKYFDDYYKYLKDRKNKDSEIVIQIKKAEEFSANQESTNSTTTTPLNYQTHPQAIYTSRLLNFSKLPKPKNEENFEKKLEELTISDLYPSNSDLFI